METNTRKGGRPRLADSQKKSFIVKISLDKGQYNLVEYKAKKAGISVIGHGQQCKSDCLCGKYWSFVGHLFSGDQRPI